MYKYVTKLKITEQANFGKVSEGSDSTALSFAQSTQERDCATSETKHGQVFPSAKGIELHKPLQGIMTLCAPCKNLLRRRKSLEFQLLTTHLSAEALENVRLLLQGSV